MAEKVGLGFNFSNIEVLKNWCTHTHRKENVLEYVGSFLYLGALAEGDGGGGLDLKSRKRKAATEFGMLTRILSFKEIGIR